MKLIFLPKGGQGFSEGSIFPIMEVPVTGEGGEKTTLSDFQWWAPTDKWQQWLKKNPREWKAESNSYSDSSSEDVFEMSSDPVISFGEFYSLLEQDESEISKEEAAKRYTKFLFAYNKLNQEKKIIFDLDLDEISKSQKYAFILDLVDDSGNPVPETRNAYEMKIIQTPQSSKFYLGELEQTILTGKIESDQSMEEVLLEVSSIVGKAIVQGVVLVSVVGLGIKAASSLGTFVRLNRVIRQVFPGMARSGSRNLGHLSRVLKSPKFFVKSLGGTIPFLKGAKGAGSSVKGFIGTLRAGRGVLNAYKAGKIASQSARLAAGAAEATNPVGWAIAALSAGQQAYNWMSGKQAPRLGEIEDAGIDAHDSFSPGSIPSGQSITICWTQEPQGGFLSSLGNVLVDRDTRTTMDVVKLGNFNGKAFFYLIDVHSESLDKVLKGSSMVLLSFDEETKFERGFFDNDDLELEIIPVEDASGLASITYFQGYCGWDELKQAYDGSDDKALEVTPNAPDEYSFHFNYGKNNNVINVTGRLVKDLSSVESVKSTLISSDSEEKSANESHSFSSVLSFREFSESPRIFEADDEEISSSSSEVYLTETQRIAPYAVEKIEYADKALEDQVLPDLLSFIVPNQYLESEEESPIKIDPIQEVTIKSPKRGTIVIETEEVPEPIPVGGEESEEDVQSEVEVEGGVPVEYTKGEVKVKFRDNPDFLNAIGIPDVTKIKDKEKKDKIKFLDMITPEEKEDLGIEDWDYIKKVKIYKDGKTGDPIMIRFKSDEVTGGKRKKIKSEDANFDTALRVAERIQAGFKESSDDESEEK